MRAHNYKRKLIGGHYRPDYSKTAKAWLTLFLVVVILGGGSYQQWVDGQPLVDPNVRILEVGTVQAYEEQVEIVAFRDPQPEPVEKTEKEQIIDYIYKVFGSDADEALVVSHCESKYTVDVVGDENLMDYDYRYDEMIGDSIGVFQIRTGGKEKSGKIWNRARANGMTADEFRVYLKDYKNNVDYAKKIFDRQGWGPWTCKKDLQ